MGNTKSLDINADDTACSLQTFRPEKPLAQQIKPRKELLQQYAASRPLRDEAPEHILTGSSNDMRQIQYTVRARILVGPTVSLPLAGLLTMSSDNEI